MAQSDIWKIINAHPGGITGNEVKKELNVEYGVTQQIERLRDKGFVTKQQGETRLSWRYFPVAGKELTE